MRNKIGVIGAGLVGATAAFALSQSGLASEIVLIDANAQRAQGEALDIEHGAAKAVFVPFHVAQPESGNQGVEIGKGFPLLAREGPLPVIALKKRGQNRDLLPAGQFFGVIHQPRLKDGLHHSIVVEHGVAAAVEIEHANAPARGLIQIAIADIALHGVFGFAFPQADFLHKAFALAGNVLVKRLVHGR